MKSLVYVSPVLIRTQGTYKPQIHVHYLPHLSLHYARHTNTLNQTFLLLSSDYSKSLHLQADRSLEFHTPQGQHYTTRLPRYGRDLKYDRRSTEALVPSVGVNGDGNGEVYRLNLEIGRYMKSYEIDVGGDDLTSAGGGALQGGINTGSVNTAAIAEDSHNLLAFGTSLGTVEFWDSRSRSRVALLPAPTVPFPDEPVAEITALQFDSSGLSLATGSSAGLIHLYDLRSPIPLLTKDQGYGYPIQTLTFLSPTTSTSATAHLLSEPKILSSDKRIVKIWDVRDGTPWTSVEPAVDLHHVEWCRDSGMLLTANEGRQQHSFFVPSLGPAPKWCSFLDNLVEEMAEDPDDPAAFGARQVGEVYDNYKFLSAPQLRALNLDHLVGTTSLLRPYMHGYFVAQQLYEQARLISNPQLWQEQRQKSIQDKIAKERESRIRGAKKAAVKVNRRLAERVLEREEKHEQRKAKRALEKGVALQADAVASAGDVTEGLADRTEEAAQKSTSEKAANGLLHDPRFASLFQDEDFTVDETSHEFRALNPSTKSTVPRSKPRGLTAVEAEALDRAQPAASGSSSSSSSDGDDDGDDAADAAARARVVQRKQQTRRADPADDPNRISTASYRTAGHRRQDGRGADGPRMHVSSTQRGGGARREARDRSFGARAAQMTPAAAKARRDGDRGGAGGAVVGERQVTFAPSAGRDKRRGGSGSGGGLATGQDGVSRKDYKDRRSASGNTFRRM